MVYLMRMQHIIHSLVSPATSLPGTPAVALHTTQAIDKEGIFGVDPRLRCNFLPLSPCSAGNSEGAPSSVALPRRASPGVREAGGRADGDRFEGGARAVGADLGDRLAAD